MYNFFNNAYIFKLKIDIFYLCLLLSDISINYSIKQKNYFHLKKVIFQNQVRCLF